MKKFYFTFGTNHKYWSKNDLLSLGRKYAVIETSDELLAREMMHKIRGPRWSFVYPAEDFDHQINEYGLEEVALPDLYLDPIDPYGVDG